jgi:succinate-semialdehyde dehydrogenase/glutarate-semialdehyde dehydrogenase
MFQHSAKRLIVRSQSTLSRALRDPTLIPSSTAVDLLPVYNPADGTLVANVENMGRAETQQAIQQAKAVGKDWAATLTKDRSAILETWYALMMEHTEDLATIMTAECGKPLAESRGEVAYAASFLKWFAEEAKRSSGDTIPASLPGRRLMTIKQPVGICGLITPWNFPAAMITRKVGPALAAGCTAIIKPSEETPLSALAVVELGRRAGVPDGVVSVITGSKTKAAEIGTELATSPDVRKLSFTGSTAVGKLLMAQSASTVKRVSLELGGNAPFIVFDDADIDAAVEGALASKFRNAGQTCVCANRFVIQDGVYDVFASKLAERVSSFVVGHGNEDNTVVGPLINRAGLDKVQEHCEDAVSKGANILVGGEPLPSVGDNFFAPTVLTEINQNMRIMSEETFGPIAPLIRFQEEKEAITIANDTTSGLAAYFYSRDVGRCFRVSEALEYGMVGVNEGVISTEVAPFGGIKESGLGREGSHQGLDEYQEVKYVCMGGI